MKLTKNDKITLTPIRYLDATFDNLVIGHNNYANTTRKTVEIVNKHTQIIKRNQKWLGLSLIVTGYLSLCLYNDEKRIRRLEKLEEDKRKRPYPTYSTTYSNKKGE